MNEDQNIFDTQIFETEKLKYKRLAGKFGLAMITLVINNLFSPYVFIFIAALFGASGELSYPAILILNEFSAYFFPIVIFYFMFKEECLSFIPDKTYKHIPAEALLLFTGGMTLGAVGTIVTKLINSLIDSIFGTGEIEDAFSGMEPMNMGEFGIFAFCICIVAPIAEEYIFRSLLLKPLRAYDDFSAALITGILFGLYHGNFDQFAYAAVVGTFYSMIAVRYNSIKPTILLHSANNFIVTFANYLPSACENAEEPLKGFLDSLAAACSYASAGLMLYGIAGLIVCVTAKGLRFNNHNRFLSQKNTLVYFITTPLVILGAVVMFVPFFD